MPYRAMFWTLLTVALTLAGLGFWTRMVQPSLRESAAATQVAPSTHPAEAATDSHLQLRSLFKGTMLLALLLTVMLLAVGFFATIREWAKVVAGQRAKKRSRTTYTDAWKLAGERLQGEEPHG